MMAAQIATFITQKQEQNMSAESLGTSTVDKSTRVGDTSRTGHTSSAVQIGTQRGALTARQATFKGLKTVTNNWMGKAIDLA